MKKLSLAALFLAALMLVGCVTHMSYTKTPDDAVDTCALWRAEIWAEHVARETNVQRRILEMRGNTMAFGGVSMRYVYFVIGEPGENGFPLFIAMHGGGGVPAATNDSQWVAMQTYYQFSVPYGIYVAVRGVRDTWNTHFNDESFPLYDRLIENMILFRNVDPNRVYLMGYSAGGDGVYGIAPRMADRFAAVHMSAGHHNWVNPINLMNTPITLQMGENDTAFNRHLETARFGQSLAALANAHPGRYMHTVLMHQGRGHAIVDNDMGRTLQTVFADSEAWLMYREGETDETPETVQINANAVDFLTPHTRDPLPTELAWDLSTRANRRSVESFFWLRAGFDVGGGTIFASYDRASNAITVDTLDINGEFYVLLNSLMVDFSQPVTIIVDGAATTHNLTPDEDIVRLTTRERGDPNFQFSAMVRIAQ
ncbi:MAG: hypothetical protein FWC95_06455 [Defluviitaleaceae bacterium]|nr:hypothetical protein [Defluviitaleaceae bacterium]